MAKRSYFNSLRGKITNRALILGIVPIVLVGLLAYTGLSRLIQEADRGLEESRAELLDKVVGANLSATANRVVQQLDGFMLERISDAVTWASAPNVINAAREAAALHAERGIANLPIEEIEAQFQSEKSLNLFPATDKYLRTQIANSLHFGEVFITDEFGYNVSLTNPTSDFVQSDEGWWQTAMDNGISVGDVEFDASAGIWSIDISVRIDDDQTGKRLGVMKSVLGVSLIQEVADRRAKEVSGGSVTVVNNQGSLLAETASRHAEDRIMSEDVNLKIEGNAAIHGAINDTGTGYALGNDSVLGYARSAGVDLYGNVVQGFNGFDWLVLVEQPTQVALAPIRNLSKVQSDLATSRKNTLLVIGVSIGVIALIALVMASLLARGIINPLNELKEAAERVAKGDTSRTVNIQSNDEIEDLAKDFDRMRNSVSILISRYKKIQGERRAS
ncbi:MAG: HAMP domain-containing protein [Gammaproteobacteria bacterium]